MSPSPRSEELIKAISEALQLKTQGGPLEGPELLKAICYFIALISHHAATRISNLQDLSLEEQTLINCVTMSIKPYFEGKRQVLMTQQSSSEPQFTKDQILQKVKQMLFDKTLTPDEGLQLVGDLLSTVTYLRSPSVQNFEHVKEIESITLEHIRGKLNLALDAIQVEQGLVTKQ